jgi:hypothetical protein
VSWYTGWQIEKPVNSGACVLKLAPKTWSRHRLSNMRSFQVQSLKHTTPFSLVKPWPTVTELHSFETVAHCYSAALMCWGRTQEWDSSLKHTPFSLLKPWLTVTVLH